MFAVLNKPLSAKLPDKQAIEDELVIDWGKPVLACLMNNKTIIEFGFRIIWRIMEISEGVLRQGLHNTPSISIILHPILVNYILIITLPNTLQQMLNHCQLARVEPYWSSSPRKLIWSQAMCISPWHHYHDKLHTTTLALPTLHWIPPNWKRKW